LTAVNLADTVLRAERARSELARTLGTTPGTTSVLPQRSAVTVGADALSSEQQSTGGNGENLTPSGKQLAAAAAAIRRWRSNASASKQQQTDSNGGRMSASGKQIAATLAGFGLLGLVFLLNELLPGPGGAQRFYERGIEHSKAAERVFSPIERDRGYNEAKQQFSRAIKLNPDFDAAYFQRALLHQRLDETDDAIADYTSVIRLKPDEWAAIYNRGLAYLSRADRERALADFVEAGRVKPDDFRSYLRRVEIYRDAGDLEQALSLQELLINRYDRNLGYRYTRAELRREIGDLEGAMRDLDAAVAITDQRAFEPYLKRGRLRRETGDTAGALADFEEAIAREPDDVLAHVERGQTYRDMGRLDAVGSEFDDAIKRSADLATGYLYRGATRLFATGDAPAAAEDLSVALDKGFEHAMSRRMLHIGIQSAEKQLGMPVTPSGDDGDLLAPGVPFKPSVYYGIIWRHIARLRAQQDDATEFQKVTQRLEMELWREARRGPPLLLSDQATRANWPGEILALFTGRTTPELVRRAAEAAPGVYARRLRLCESDFYIAEHHLTKNERAEARTLLQAVVETCPVGVPETAFAKSELARLAGSGQN
jgi:tetratricopeptide (TPR) repeat protein